MSLLRKFNEKRAAKLRTDKRIDEFRPGDTVAVGCKITEGNNTRIQIFEGVVIGKGRGTDELHAFVIVRKMSHGIGVEKKFLIHSPLVDEIKTVRKGVVRRGKLYYLRDLTGKAARIREKIFVAEPKGDEEKPSSAKRKAKKVAKAEKPEKVEKVDSES